MKRSKFFNVTVVMAMITVLSLAGTALAGPGGWGQGHRQGGHWNNGPQATMTQEQQAELQGIYSEHYNKVQPLREQLRSKGAELDALYYSGKKDDRKAQSLYREIADIKAKMYNERMDLRAKLDEKGLRNEGGMHYGRDGRGQGGMHHEGRGYGHGGYNRGHGGGYGGNAGNCPNM